MKKLFGVLFVAGVTASILSFNSNEISDFEGTNAPDLQSSYVSWRGSKADPATGKDKAHYGNVGIKDAKVKLKANTLEALTVTVDLDKMTNQDLPAEMQGKLVSHLKSADFFDIVKYPDATFTSTKITKLTGDKFQFNMEGNIKVRGVSQPIEVKGHLVQDKGKTLLESEVFYLNGEKFGFIKPGGGYNNVEFRVQLYVN